MLRRNHSTCLQQHPPGRRGAVGLAPYMHMHLHPCRRTALPAPRGRLASAFRDRRRAARQPVAAAVEVRFRLLQPLSAVMRTSLICRTLFLECSLSQASAQVAGKRPVNAVNYAPGWFLT
jgi:hypothetical protein